MRRKKLRHDGFGEHSLVFDEQDRELERRDDDRHQAELQQRIGDAALEPPAQHEHGQRERGRQRQSDRREPHPSTSMQP